MSCKVYFDNREYDSLRDIEKVLEESSKHDLPYNTIDETDSFNDPIEIKPVPSLKAKVQLLENTIDRLENRLLKIKQEKNIKDITDNEYKILLKEEATIDNILENKDKGLKNMLFEYKNKDLSLESIVHDMRKDMSRLAKIIASKNLYEIDEARELLSFYTNLRLYPKNYQNPFFTKEEMLDEQGFPRPHFKAFFDSIQDIITEADRLQGRFDSNERDRAREAVNTNISVLKTFDRTLTDEEIFHDKTGMTDINIITQYMQDPEFQFFTNSNNGIFPQVSKAVITDSASFHMQFSVYLDNKIKDLEPRLLKIMEKIGVNLNFNIFRAKDKNGDYKDTVIQRVTSEMITEESDQRKVFEQRRRTITNDTTLSPVDKQKQRLQLRRDILKWYNERYHFMDFRKLSDITSEFSDLIPDNMKGMEDENYKKELLELLGEYGYEEFIEERKRTLREYRIRQEVFRDTLEERIAEENFSEKNADSFRIREMKMWENLNNPITFLEMWDNYGKENSFPQESYFLHNSSLVTLIPRAKKTTYKDKKLVETNEDSGYYDENFKKLEKTEELREFHKLLMEFLHDINDNVMPKDREMFNIFSIPAMEKGFMELIKDPETNFLVGFSKALKVLFEKIRNLFKQSVQSEFSYAERDPVTGEVKEKINNEFLKFNKRKIEKLTTIALLRIRQQLGLKAMQKLGEVDLTKVDSDFLLTLTNTFGIENSLAAIQKRFPNSDINNFHIEKSVKAFFTNQVVLENSLNLPKIIRNVSYAMAIYKARQETYPLLRTLKEQYFRIKRSIVNRQGDPLRHYNADEPDLVPENFRAEGLRNKAIEQYQSWWRRNILGDYSKKTVTSPFFKKRTDQIGIKFLDDKLAKKPEVNSNQDIIDFLDETYVEIKGSNYYEDDEGKRSKDLATVNKLLNTISEKRQEYSFIAFSERVFDIVRFLGLGYNLSSAITNFFEGQFSNFVNMGRYFDEKTFAEATDIVKYTTLRSLTFQKIRSDNSPVLKEKLFKAELARYLMENYNVLQDVYNEMQRASVKSRIQKLNKLHPKEIPSRTEYNNQTPVFLATLMETKIKDNEGKNEISLWEAYLKGAEKSGAFGMIPENYSKEGNSYIIDKSQKTVSKEYAALKRKVTSYITKFHGDYSEFGGNMLSESIEGQALMMFKRWLGSYMYNLFGTTQYNIHTGKQEKGRFLSITGASGGIMGAVAGMSFLGPIGAIGGLTVGLGYGIHSHATKVQDNTTVNLSLLRQMAINSMMMLKSFYGLPVNLIAGKQVVKPYSNATFDEKFSELDVKNIKANMANMALLLWLTAFTLLVKGLAWDDDDEKDSKRRLIHNVMVNKLMTMSDQIATFMSPAGMYDNFLSLNSIAIFRFSSNVYKTSTEFIQMLEGDDLLLTGPNAGDSAFWNQFKKTFIPSPIKGFGFSSYTERQFTKSPFDRWFHNEEYIYQNMIRKLKREEKNSLNYDEMSEEEKSKVDSRLNKKYKKKKTYRETYERVKE